MSIAGSHTPITPIANSISATVTAGRRPETTRAIAVSPAIVTNHGSSTRKTRSGSSAYSTRKFPIGSVIWKMNELGSWT